MANFQHFGKFRVENFKRFEVFEMDNLGQFNVIVGDNNVGKSSILEALMVDKDIGEFLKCLKYILFNVKKFDNLKDLYLWHYLNKKIENSMIRIDFNYVDQPSNRIEILMGDRWSFYITSNIRTGITPEQRVVEDEALKKQKLFPYQNIGNLGEKDNSEVHTKGFHAPLIPFQITYQHDLAEYFDANIEKATSKLNQLKKDLKILIPDLIDIRQRSSIADKVSVITFTVENKDEPLPLGTYGDGVIKLFRILIEMQIHAGKRLMVDEIDTGIHYSRMKSFWKTVIHSARNNNVQLFATTHSDECIGSFTQVLEEEGQDFQKDARIIHIEEIKKTHQVKAYTYPFNEFDHALNVGNELR